MCVWVARSPDHRLRAVVAGPAAVAHALLDVRLREQVEARREARACTVGGPVP